MQDHHIRRHVRIGSMTAGQLAALTRELAPYRSQPITALVVERAIRAVRGEVRP